MRDYEGRNSFYPAAKKVFANPIVKWVGGAALAAITAAVTTGIWPFFKGWVITRASTEVVTQLDTRLGKLESARVVSIVMSRRFIPRAGAAERQAKTKAPIIASARRMTAVTTPDIRPQRHVIRCYP